MSFFDKATNNMNKKVTPKTEKAKPFIEPIQQMESRQSLSIVEIESDISVMVKQALDILSEGAEAFEITNQETLDQSAEMILQSNKIKNTIEACRKKRVRPFLDAQQEINAFTKPHTSICENIKDGLSKKRCAYQKEQREIEMKRQREEEEKARKEAEKERLEIERLQKEAEKLRIEAEKARKAGEPVKIIPVPVPPPPPPPKPETFAKPIVPAAPKKFSDGRVDTKVVVVFEVEDLEKVPHKFLVIDEAAVKRSLDAGVREIPGLIIKEEMKEVFRTGRR